MSAIGALLWRSAEAADDRALARIENSLRIHGPDRRSRRIIGRCGLVSTLMLGFTPEDGLERQPLASPARRHLVFAGWVSNRAEMLDALGIEPVRRAAMPDSAVALAAWERWGEAAPARLDGSFALLLWDEASETLHAARSAGTAPPLHYHGDSRRHVFATVPTGIFALGDVERRLDPIKLAQNLRLDFDDRERSYFEGVRRVPAGHLLTLAGDRAVLRSLCDSANAPEVRYARDRDYVDAANELLDRAVADHLRANETPAIALSAGLDSGAVAVAALDRLGGSARLPAFTAVPESGWDGRVLGASRIGDESDPVRALAARYPALDQHFIDSAGEDLTAHLDQIFQLGEVPPRNIANIFWWVAITRAGRASGSRVMLNGASGNATIGFEVPGRSRTGLDKLVSRIRGGADGGAGMLRWSAIHPDLVVSDEGAALPATPREAAPLTLFGGERDEAGSVALAIQTLTGVQDRDPLGDRRLAEYCIGLAPDQFARGRVNRRLVRRMMAGRLVPEVLASPRGRQAADRHLRLTRQRAALRAELERDRGDPALAALVDFDRLLALIDDWPARTPLSAADHPDHLIAHVGLPRAICNLRFARWVEGRN